MDYNGMPAGVNPSQGTPSRVAEFSGGISGGGSTHPLQGVHPDALPSAPYKPSGVLSPVAGSGIGQSASTYSANRVLDYYRS